MCLFGLDFLIDKDVTISNMSKSSDSMNGAVENKNYEIIAKKYK